MRVITYRSSFLTSFLFLKFSETILTNATNSISGLKHIAESNGIEFFHF